MRLLVVGLLKSNTPRRSHVRHGSGGAAIAVPTLEVPGFAGLDGGTSGRLRHIAQVNLQGKPLKRTGEADLIDPVETPHASNEAKCSLAAREVGHEGLGSACEEHAKDVARQPFDGEA